MPAETHVVDGPLDRDAIFAIVRDQLVDILEIDPENISEGQSFKDDLNADSLALVELVDALEEELSERTVGFCIFFFFQAEDGIRDFLNVTGVQTCALPIS